jgi:CheY-like chemotaxis protein
MGSQQAWNSTRRWISPVRADGFAALQTEPCTVLKGQPRRPSGPDERRRLAVLRPRFHISADQEGCVTSNPATHRLKPILLPATLPPAPAAEEVNTQPQARILIVEDDQSIADLLRELFELEGYAVETASRGRIGLLRVANSHVDLVILDLKLPDLTGLAVCNQIRTWEREQLIRSRTPIVVLTAAGGRDLADDCQAAGADEYLAKPFDIGALVEAVDQLIGVRAMADFSR